MKKSQKKSNGSKSASKAGRQPNYYESYKAKQMVDPAFRRAFEEGLDLLRLGVEIAALRERSGLSQTQLAALLNTSASVISRVENGENVEIKTLQKIATALNTELKIELVPLGAK